MSFINFLFRGSKAVPSTFLRSNCPDDTYRLARSSHQFQGTIREESNDGKRAIVWVDEAVRVETMAAGLREKAENFWKTMHSKAKISQAVAWPLGSVALLSGIAIGICVSVGAVAFPFLGLAIAISVLAIAILLAAGLSSHRFRESEQQLNKWGNPANALLAQIQAERRAIAQGGSSYALQKNLVGQFLAQEEFDAIRRKEKAEAEALRRNEEAEALRRNEEAEALRRNEEAEAQARWKTTANDFFSRDWSTTSEYICGFFSTNPFLEIFGTPDLPAIQQLAGTFQTAKQNWESIQQPHINEIIPIQSNAWNEIDIKNGDIDARASSRKANIESKESELRFLEEELKNQKEEKSETESQLRIIESDGRDADPKLSKSYENLKRQYQTRIATISKQIALKEKQTRSKETHLNELKRADTHAYFQEATLKEANARPIREREQKKIAAINQRYNPQYLALAPTVQQITAEYGRIAETFN